MGSTGRPETPSGAAAEQQTGGGGPAADAARSGLAVVDPPSLAEALAAEEEGLLTCVHCGFCLPACPTYTRLGDENDSPRGRLYLMRAVVEGRLDAASDAFQVHIDRCVGCRACEPVCPSGVPYGSLLELARTEASKARPPSFLTRAFLRVFGSADATAAFLAVSRAFRATGLPALGARLLPSLRWTRALRLALGMLAASGAWGGLRRAGGDGRPRRGSAGPAGRQAGPGAPGAATPDDAGAPDEGAFPSVPMAAGSSEIGEDRRLAAGAQVGILEGCVQGVLFSRVNDATVRVLEANGVAVEGVADQRCCGAIHAHGGDLGTARALARRNIDAFDAAGAEWVVVNAAGCGAIMKEYGHLLAGDAAYADRAARFSARVLDVSEALAALGPRRGGEVRLSVAYDAPCHLLHAQGVADPPRTVLRSIPGVELVELEAADECCGGAGIYGLLHPDLGGRMAMDKVEAVRRSGAGVVATGNPGCIMQIGAGLRIGRVDARPVHPVEILDESYRRAGMYGGGS